MGVKKQGYALRMDQRGTKPHQNYNPNATQLSPNLHTEVFSPHSICLEREEGDICSGERTMKQPRSLKNVVSYTD